MDKLKKKPKIIWKKPSKKKIKSNRGLLETINLEMFNILPQNLISEELIIPYVKGVKTPKEELIILLKVAAEIEHALMIQYLYPAYSVNSASNEEPKQTLRNIAIQEMGHFLAVQNLLLSIGGIENIHLHKSNYRPTDKEDNPLPFTLEPLSKNLLAKFVAIEAPLELPPKLKEEVEAIHQIGKGKAGVKLNPVGGLYMKIFWLFQKDDSPVNDMMVLHPNEDLKANWHIKDSDFLPIAEIEKYEAIYDTWDNSGAAASHNIKLSKVHERNDALKLVFEVSAQGEGANFDDNIPTHFELFLATYRNYDQLAAKIITVPINPCTKINPEFTISHEVKNRYSLLWCSLFNSIYTSMLLDIYSSIFYKQFNRDSPIDFIKMIFNCMRTIITSTSGVMQKLPLLDNEFQYNKEPRCGATFEIGTNFTLSTNKTDVDNLNASLVAEIQSKIDEIKHAADYQNHIDADNADERNVSFALRQVANYCQLKSQVLSTIITT